MPTPRPSGTRTAAPSDVDMIEHGYLRDHQEPYFEVQPGFDVDGQKIKVRHVTGFKAIDWRGMVRSSGV